MKVLLTKQIRPIENNTKTENRKNDETLEHCNDSVLQTLAIRAVPPIHIIVENGNVTLEGMVLDEMQENIAGIQANSVNFAPKRSPRHLT